MIQELWFGFGRRLPVMLQTQTTECGLACLGMIAEFHGSRTDMPALRARFPVSLRGATLAQLIQFANDLELNSRPLSVQLEELRNVRVPCILHWEFDHFVVLHSVGKTDVIIHDPAIGRRKVTFAELAKSFTGVALELWPSPGFKPKDDRQRLRLRQMLGRTTGVFPLLAQIFALAIALEVCTLVFPFITQWVVDEVIVSNDRDLLTTLALGFALLLFFQQATSAIRGWIIMYLDSNVSVRWQGNVFDHLMRLPLEYFMRRHLGDIVSRFGSIDQIQRTVTTSFITAILDGIMSIVTLVMMFVYSWILSLIGVGALVLYVGIRWARYGALRGATEGQIVAAARQQTYFLESVRGIKAIKLFQRESDRRSSWLSLLVRQTNASIRTQKAQLLYETARGVLSGIERIWVLWLGARMVMDGDFTVGALMAFVSYKDQFDTRMTSLVDRCFEVKMLQVQGQRLADIVLTKPERLPVEDAAEPDSPEVPTLELRNVHFRYADYEPFILKGVNLSVSPGESLVITGPSGGGKTTLINMVLGTLTPTKGQVLVAGTNLRKFGVASLRRISGTVTQDDMLFAGSIADNISFFDAKADSAWIRECARIAMIHDDIMAMPMKYRTLVGDMGTVLSGGQRQRVLLARALYRKPKIMIMDEATSHLDMQLETRLVAAVRALDMTRLIVAHRRETIACADRVIVLRNGTIAQDSSRAQASLSVGND